jgi:hypothetical protein
LCFGILFNFYQVHKLQNLGSILKHNSVLLEVADCWAGTTLEETHEEDDVEAADDDHDDPSQPTPHAPRSDPVGRLSGDMKEHQLQAVVGAGKNKCPQKPCIVYVAHKKT